MPLITSQYQPPSWLFNGHLETVWPFLVRQVPLQGEPVEIPLNDGDRLLADYYQPTLTGDGTKPVLVIAHGLEGNSRRPYVLGLAKAALALGYSVLAWNFRSCGWADNNLPIFYNAGCSNDLDQVITWVSDRGHGNIELAGFSMGGNITLKWLGEVGSAASQRGVRAAAVFSVPCDLMGCTEALGKPTNTLYRRRFVRDLKARLLRKAERFPGQFDLKPLAGIHSVWGFDNAYTAPLHGYRDADHYYEQCSAQRFIGDIRVPTLLLSARNDPFLSASCFPFDQARQHNDLYLEAPEQGGHVGFYCQQQTWWAENRALEFLAMPA